MAGGKGKSSGGKSSGGKVGADGNKKQQSHSSKAGLQVSIGTTTLFLLLQPTAFALSSRPSTIRPSIPTLLLELELELATPHHVASSSQIRSLTTEREFALGKEIIQHHSHSEHDASTILPLVLGVVGVHDGTTRRRINITIASSSQRSDPSANYSFHSAFFTQKPDTSATLTTQNPC